MPWTDTHVLTPDLAKLPLEKWAEALKLGRMDADTFNNVFTRARNEYGLDFYRLLDEGLRNQRAGKNILSDPPLEFLAGMASQESGLQGNIATIPTQAFTDSTLKTILPLSGCDSPDYEAFGPVPESQVGMVFYQHGLRSRCHLHHIPFFVGASNIAPALRKGLISLAAVGGGELAVSALADLYNEMSSLPQQGQHDVTQALNLCNRFGATIGITPFHGHVPKAKPAVSEYNRIRASRERLAAAIFRQL
jgi:hypothetical protein